MAILAAGVGFALRGGIFGAWASEYGFTATQLGAIGGAGFTGFCFGIIIGGVIVDKLGYGKLVALALLGHVLSAVVTFMATKQNAYDFLYWGMFIFAYANGTLEAVANPLVATVYPQNRTHYLNILHASWPLGMVVGAVASYLLGNVMGFGWKGQLAFYLVPTAAYAIMFMGQSFPKSEAAAKGASFADMFKDVGLLGAAVVCYLLALFFGGAAMGFTVGGVLLIAVGVLTRFSFGSFLLFVLFITTRSSARSSSAPTAGSRPSPATSSRRSRARSSSSGPPPSCSACASAPTSSRPSSVSHRSASCSRPPCWRSSACSSPPG